MNQIAREVERAGWSADSCAAWASTAGQTVCTVGPLMAPGVLRECGRCHEGRIFRLALIETVPPRRHEAIPSRRENPLNDASETSLFITQMLDNDNDEHICSITVPGNSRRRSSTTSSGSGRPPASHLRSPTTTRSQEGDLLVDLFADDDIEGDPLRVQHQNAEWVLRDFLGFRREHVPNFTPYKEEA